MTREQRQRPWDLYRVVILGAGVAFLIFMLTGCAQKMWVHPEYTPLKFQRDKQECLAQATTIAGGDAFVGLMVSFDPCMESRGWVEQ